MPSPAKRGDILDRRGRVLATSVDADIDLRGAVGDRRRRRRGRRSCAARSATARARNGRRWPSGSAAAARSPTCGGRLSPDQARRVAALNLDGIGFIKESKRFYPNKELAAHLLGYVGIDNTGLSGLESTYDSQIRGKAGTILVQTDARRHAFSRFERPPTAGSTIELTIDEYLQHIAERELHAGVVENRAAGGTAIIMNPHTGEILAMANEPTFNPNAYREFAGDRAAQPRRAGSLRAGLDVQGRDRVGGDRREGDADRHDDRHQSRASSRSGRPRRSTEASDHNYGVLSFTDVIVKSSNVGAIKIGFRVGTERLSRLRLAASASASRSRPIFPARARASCGVRRSGPRARSRRCRWAIRSASRRCRWWRRSARSPTAASCVEPRVVRAVYRDNRRYAVAAEGRAPHDQRRHRGDADDDHGRRRRATAPRRRAQIPGYTIAGKTGTAAKLVNGHYSTVRLQRLVRRLPAVAQPGGRDHRRHRLAARRATTGGTVSAPIFKRIAEATLRYLGIAADVNPAAAGARRAPRRRRARARPRPTRRGADRQPGRRRAAGHGARSARPERARSGAHARASSG